MATCMLRVHWLRIPVVPRRAPPDRARGGHTWLSLALAALDRLTPPDGAPFGSQTGLLSQGVEHRIHLTIWVISQNIR